MAARSLSLLLFFAALWGPSFCLYSKSGPVTLLNDKNFERIVLRSNVVTVVEFYASWCGHCKALAPSYEKVAESLKGIVEVAAIDCGEQENIRLCAHFDVQGFPTIKVYPIEKQKDPKTGAITKTPEDYTGPRSAKPLSDYAKSQVSDVFIHKVEGVSDFQAFLDENEEEKKVILFTEKREPPLLMKSLSARFQDEIKFAQVHSSDSEVVKEFKVNKFPSIVIFKEGKNYEHYEGELKAVSLLAYLEESVVGKKDEEKHEALFQLRQVDLDAISKISQDEEDVWLVAFYGISTDEQQKAEDDHCDKELREFASLTKDLQLMVEVAATNVTKNQAGLVAKYGVNVDKLFDEPCNLQLVRFPFGDDKDFIEEYELYKGQPEAKPIQNFVLQAIPTLAAELNAQSLDMFMDGSFGGKGDNPLLAIKILLFTAKPECPPIYNALVSKFRKFDIAFGFYPNADESALERFPNKKLPALVALRADPAMDLEAAKKNGRVNVPFQIQPYTGPIKYEILELWVQFLGKGWGAIPEDPESAGSAGAKVSEITDTEAMQTSCEKVGICAIALLDKNSETFDEDLKAVGQLALKRAGDPLGFYWVDVKGRSKLLEGFSVVRSDVPLVVALSARKMRFALMRETMTMEHMDEFLNGVLSGRVRTAPIQDLPSLAASAEEESDESGGAAEEVVLEDEIDLDEIMSEEVEAGTKEDVMKKIDEELEMEAERKKKEEEEASKAKSKKKKKKGKKGKKKKKKSSSAAKDEL
ncbi:hypothetical protein BSKO_10191 [Bryopsis sp. KO-2023]|nr:hypothetical protein BSKO_10191 [Bryopsis sp. KO-2023]